MDGATVSRIERWTRNLLEAEARKRGVRDAELRSRTELLRAIVQKNARKLVTSLLPMFGNKSAPPPRSHVLHASSPAPLPTPAAPQPPSRLAIERDHSELKLSWHVNDADTERARALLGHRGELALRIVTVRPDPARVVQSEVTEHGPLDASGRWTLLLSGPDANCVGAVGVRHGERFVSIVHTTARGPGRNSPHDPGLVTPLVRMHDGL
jgi:hypothetical protein